mmetsp:Transcript_22611/g.22928  ORF Transcript_22611/g.22928 Transcript_22611/m.22928 type:complete len:224 (-) Transcript_22611:535-1206(-)
MPTLPMDMLREIFLPPPPAMVVKPSSSTSATFFGTVVPVVAARFIWRIFPLEGKRFCLCRFPAEVERLMRSSLATSLCIWAIVLAVSSFLLVTQPLSLISHKSCNINLDRWLALGPFFFFFFPIPAIISTRSQHLSNSSLTSYCPEFLSAIACSSRFAPIVVINFVKHATFSSSISPSVGVLSSPSADLGLLESNRMGRQRIIIRTFNKSALYISPINRKCPK